MISALSGYFLVTVLLAVFFFFLFFLQCIVIGENKLLWFDLLWELSIIYHNIELLWCKFGDIHSRMHNKAPAGSVKAGQIKTVTWANWFIPNEIKAWLGRRQENAKPTIKTALYLLATFCGNQRKAMELKHTCDRAHENTPSLIRICLSWETGSNMNILFNTALTYIIQHYNIEIC